MQFRIRPHAAVALCSSAHLTPDAYRTIPHLAFLISASCCCRSASTARRCLAASTSAVEGAVHELGSPLLLSLTQPTNRSGRHQTRTRPRRAAKLSCSRDSTAGRARNSPLGSPSPMGTARILRLRSATTAAATNQSGSYTVYMERRSACRLPEQPSPVELQPRGALMVHLCSDSAVSSTLMS